ncbi:sn-glycerol-3-phosphate ABC transporter ATP-binding protein UgpC [Mesorhizobium sp. B3-1-9]|uniref:ABC transporter ATP-binding protein n=1 Tax=Mesorhizobium sp. B3-1-9 TaxID=2589892 RepID=UPI00112861A4|nr:sn-glycerol-3-phosphate ABC transporter ATP-binding protein UgpC [Mesorhizobium sp. B3-1-9]TPI38152.1 sn-glycerol-3-phosphate ABC transporter ATP-binding protein UgpC [Mesorhizobium sp. B3-1-9]
MGSIGLRKVGKLYGPVQALKDVNLEIRDGEFVVFVGPSGCGKSTLLRMIAGLESVTSGEISINGKTMNDVSPRDRDIAMVFQNYALYPQMTVRENIAFALELRKTPKSEIDKRVAEAARILDLSELLDRKPRELSGGQRQRVAMGRAIVRNPEAFLLDEPLSNLDAKLRVQLRAELSRLHTRLGVTTIHVTHDQVEAMTLGSRVAVFSRGTLQQYDTPHALYHAPANIFVAGFIGSPAMNFLEAKVIETQADALVVSIGDRQVSVRPKVKEPGLAAGDTVILGIRPEHLSWQPAGSGAGIPAKVELVEQLEPESFIAVSPASTSVIIRTADDYARGAVVDPAELVRIDARLLVLRVGASRVPARETSLELVVDGERVHLFDSSTGKAL